MEVQSTQDQVRKRRVFYIPGYDPFHPRRYRELYRKESAAQAAISGYEIALRPKTGGGLYGWQVEAEIDGARTRTDFEVFVWSDIVRDSMSNSIAQTYLQLIRTAWIYISTGALFRLMRLRKGPVIAALYPVGMLLGQLALAVALGWVVFRGVNWIAAGALGAPWPAVIGSALGAVAGWLALEWFKRRDGRFFAYYLMHDYAFSARWRGANPPEIETRMAEFGATIRAALGQGYDEVLVVGHSSGAHLGISVLADVLREGLPDGHAPLNFLSLGQVVPMVSFLPDAWRLRADLVTMSEQDEVFWMDVTAPGDGCAFALCDPVAVTGVATKGKRWPLIISAAFTQTLSLARWRSLRWRFFRLHFQYLCAFDRAGDYDYFRITAGAQTLRARFLGRQPSKSVIARATSRFRSVAP